MAAALLGKCIALLALLLLLYSCCFAFRIRDAGTPGDHSRPTSCPAGSTARCTEKSTVTSSTIAASAATSSLRRKYDSLVTRHSQPPVEFTHRDDREDDDDDDEKDDDGDVTSDTVKISRSRSERNVKGKSKLFAGSLVGGDDAGRDEEEDDADDEGITIDSEPMSEELEDADEDVSDEEETPENEDEEDDGEDDDEEDDEEDVKDLKKVEKKHETRHRHKDRDDDEDNGIDDDSEEHIAKKRTSLGKATEEKTVKKQDAVRFQSIKVKKIVKSPAEKTEDENDEDDDVEERQSHVQKQSSKTVRIKSSPKKDDDEDDGDDEEDDKDDKNDDDDEDEEDDNDDTEEESTPPPRKLEKVRHADKKYKSAEVVTEKPKVDAKKETVDRKKAEPVKKAEAEAPKPKVTKPEVELHKAEETKPETKAPKPKITKTDTESSKPKASKAEIEPPKPKVTRPETEPSAPKTKKPEAESPKKEKPKAEEKPKQPVKTESSKTSSKSGNEATKAVKSKTKSVEVKPAVTPKVLPPESNDTKLKAKRRTESSISLSQLNDAILHVATFLPNFTAVEDPVCQQQGKIFLRQLRGYRLWALQMLDASAKVPSGLLRGNVNQLGDFDECLGITARVKVDEKTVKILGKYCLASIDLHALHPDMKLPVNLVQARAFIRSNIRDPGHFIPKFTTVRWALCLPAACSAEDAEKALEMGLRDYNVTSGLRFIVEVDSSMCYVQQKSQSYSKETIAVLYFYAMIICLVTVATVRDYLVTSAGKGNYSERIIMAFSLRKTVKDLLKQEAVGREEISCIHGIRSVATIILYVAHQLIPVSRLPFVNRVTLTEVSNNPVSSILRVSLVYTDSFLLLSGLLTAYNMTKELEKRGEIRWFCRFISRFVRLTPALVVVVFWYAFIMEHTGSGPQWNSVIVANADLCKKSAWTNLLYVQNFFPFEEMCAAHTHQLALDMQLSLIAPILVFILYYKPIIGILMIFFILQVSATLRYIATVNNYLSIVIFHGMSLKHLYKTANLTYMLALHRATPYVFGVGLGVLLHYTGKNVKIHKILVILGWMIAITLGSWSLFSPWRLARRDYVYDVEEATHYAVIGPVSWALFISWTIFACFTDHGGFVNKFLSNYWLVVFSRISYAVYLTQFAVFFYNVGTTRYSTEFQLHRAIDPFEAVTVIAVSTILTLLFDLPMQEVKNVIMECTDGSVAEVSGEVDAKEKVEGTVEEPTKDQKDLDDDEVASTGWDWQKDITQDRTNVEQRNVEEDEPIEVPDYTKSNGRRRTFVSSETQESEEILAWDRLMDKRFSRENADAAGRQGRSRSNQRRYTYDSDEDADYGEVYRVEHPSDYPRKMDNGDAVRQYRRSETRGRSYPRETEDRRSRDPIHRDRSSSRGPDKRSFSKIETEQEPVRQSRGPLLKGPDTRKTMSSESEEELIPHRRLESTRRYPSVEPRMSDEEGWEEELRIRRRRFKEKLASQEREIEAEDLRRRSSAEGKIALLREPIGTDNMDSWTVSRVPAISHLGSSQEPSEPEDEDAYTRREYRENAPPFRDELPSEEESSWDNSRRRSNTTGSQVTSLDDEEDVATYDFVLRKESKRTSLQDLSKLLQEESELESSGWNLVKKENTDAAVKSAPLGLIKRESIIKSQASEEDPEYMLPERPKLVEQEQEHPFKKAWQMQKSRSEEDYLAKDSKQQQESKRKETESPASRKEASGGEQSAEVPEETDSLAVSLDSRSSESRSSDTKSSNTPSTDTKNQDTYDNRPSSISGTDEDSSRFDWPTEDEQFQVHMRERRRSSEDGERSMEEEET